MSASRATLVLLSVLLGTALSQPGYFTCGTGEGDQCGWAAYHDPNEEGYWGCQYPGEFCNMVCGKTVINNQLGQWALVNKTLTAVNTLHPLSITYQQIPNVPVWTLALLPAGQPNLPVPHFRITVSTHLIEFDADWNSRPDAIKQHILAMAMYSLAGQCFGDLPPGPELGPPPPYNNAGAGRLGYSWNTYNMGMSQPDDPMSGVPFSNIMNNVYNTFFISMDEQFSSQICYQNFQFLKVIGPEHPNNYMQFLTFKPTSIKIYFNNNGVPTFAGILLTNSDSSLLVPPGLNYAGLNWWEATMADNEFISAIRFNRDNWAREVTCVGFEFTNLDGGVRSYGGCTEETYYGPYSFVFKTTGTWVFTTKC